MPFVNTTPTYQTVETSVEHQIGLHFTCPVCGKDSGWIDRNVSVTAESTGIVETAEKLAYQKAETDLEETLKQMDAENMMQILGEPVKCPHCGAIQLAGRRERTVSKKGCISFLIPALILALLYALFLFTDWIAKTALALILATGVAFIIGILLLIGYKLDSNRRNRLAIESPEMELKYLGAVHNSCIEVDFRKRGPGGIVKMEPSPDDDDDEEEDEDEE